MICHPPLSGLRVRPGPGQLREGCGGRSPVLIDASAAHARAVDNKGAVNEPDGAGPKTVIGNGQRYSRHEHAAREITFFCNIFLNFYDSWNLIIAAVWSLTLRSVLYYNYCFIFQKF